MSDQENSTNKIIVALKSKWWLILIVAIVAVLLLIPTKSGLPDNNYRGCINEDPQYQSTCLTSKIKSITAESGDSAAITVPVEFSDGTEDVTFHLNGGRGLKVGDAIFINVAEWDKRAYLFINGDSNMLFTILSTVFNGSQSATAVIDLDTMKETKSTLER